MQKEKRMGPKVEPCSTPQAISQADVIDSHRAGPIINGIRQHSAKLEIPSRHSIKILWLIVSEAELKSIRTKSDHSTVQSCLLAILMRANSVLL